MQIDKENTEHIQHALIVVFGPPASGKTTFARNLQSSYNLNHHTNQSSCLILSADCLQEYLRNHSIKSLSELINDKKQFQQLNQYKLDRSRFIQKNWKESRMFIKSNLTLILSRWKVVILQDDMLLRSQRKQIRQIAEVLKIKYVQILISTSLQQCLKNWKIRQQLAQSKFNGQSIVKQAYQKLQIDNNPYLLLIQQVYTKQQNLWEEISNKLKQVVVIHPQLIEKYSQSEQNRQKDKVQIEIRKFISEIMKSKEQQLKLFGQISQKKVNAQISSIKKRYNEKNKTLKGFINFLYQQTGQTGKFEEEKY